MDMSTQNLILVAIFALLASAFFSGMEFAFISANRLKVELQKQKKSFLARPLSLFYNRPTQFLGTTLVGNNIALVVYGASIAKLLEPYLESVFPSATITLLVQTLISTFFILIFGEFLPKNLVRLGPTKMLQLFALPLNLIYWLFYPFVTFIVALSKWLLSTLFSVQYKEEKAVFERIDLQHYIEQNNIIGSEENAANITFIQKALNLTDVKVRECMVPRTEVVGVEINDPLEAIKRKFIESKHSKLIVYKDNIDTIQGYYHHQDIIKNKNQVPRFWDILKVPESMLAEDLLHRLISERKSIAWVIDEFGGTAGIVTMEDIIEEIFGEIRDEHDADPLTEIVREGVYLLSGRLEIDYLNEKYPELNLPEGEYETLAGYILSIYQGIPEKGIEIGTEHLDIFVEEAHKTGINLLRLVLKKENQP